MRDGDATADFRAGQGRHQPAVVDDLSGTGGQRDAPRAGLSVCSRTCCTPSRESLVVGAREQRLADCRPVRYAMVTWCDRRGVAYREVLSSLGPRLAQRLGSQPEPGRCPMSTTNPSAALVPVTAGVHQHRAAGVSRIPGRLQRPDPAGLRAGPAPVRVLVPAAPAAAVRRPAAPTSSASPVTWKPAAAPGPPSPAGCARSPGSTSTPSRKSCSTTHPPRTSAGRAWTTSRMPPGWTATSSARCWSPPGSACPPSTR